MSEISELIKVELGDIINGDAEDFYDLICELTNSTLIHDPRCEIEGHEGNTLILRVRGEVEDGDEDE